MNEQVLEDISGPGAWLGPEIQDNSDLIHELSDAAISGLDAALRHARKTGAKIPFTKDEFPLPGISDELGAILREVGQGRGFCVVRGVPRERYSDEECELLYWGIGVHAGNPVSQNARGHLLGHVTDEGRDFGDPMARGYQTAQRMDFHCDLLPVDLLGLFCLRQAKSGGMNHLVSSLTVHNVIRRERPDLLDVLYQPFFLDWRGEEPAGEPPWFHIPMFSARDGQVTSRFTSREYCQSCERFGTEYALTDLQNEALDKVQEIANRPELRISLRQVQGDILLINNHMIMHARDAYEDYGEPERKRYLLRMWIGLADEIRRPLSPALDGRYNLVANGGIPVKQLPAA